MRDRMSALFLGCAVLLSKYVESWLFINLTSVRTDKHADAMSALKPPTHVRRTKWSKRVQLVLAISAAGFVLYRLISAFTSVMH
jgi:hypothetical protein